MSCKNCSSCSCEAEDVQEIQQFVPGKEYAVGEFFKYGKNIYKVVNSDYNGCPLCDLKLCDEFNCTCCVRLDSIDVEAILYDSEE